MKKYLFTLLVVLSLSSYAQTTYVWNGATTNFTDSNNWTPTRSTPAPNDILVFNNGSTNSVTNVPSQTIGQLIVQNNTTVNLQADAANNTLTISNLTGVDLLVEAGSTLRIQSTTVCTLLVNTSATAEIYGTIAAAGAAHRFLANSVNSFFFKNGGKAIAETNFAGNMFGNSGTSNTTIFEAGSEYIFKDGANPFGLTAPNSKVVFQTNSKYIHQNGFTPPASTGRTYAIFEMDHPSFNGSLTGGIPMTCQKIIVKQANNLNINLTAPVNVLENIEILSGILTRGSTGSLNVNGSILLNGGNMIYNSTGALTVSGSVVLNSGNMNYTSTGALTIFGDLTVNFGCNFSLTPVLSTSRTDLIGGNLNNSGIVVFNPTVIPPNYNLVFQTTSSTPQNITNSGTLVFSPSVMVSLPDADGYTLGSDIHIQGILNLPTDNVKINANGHTVTLGLNNTFPGFLNVSMNPSYFYNGKFRRYFAANTTTNFISGGFPIGIASDIQSCAILMTNGPSSGGFITAEFVTGYAGNLGLPLIVNAVNVNRVYGYGYYRIIADASLAGYVYTFQMVGTNYYGVGDYQELVLLKRDNNTTPWTDGGGMQGVPSGSNAQFTLNLSGLTTFSEFIVGGNDTPNPLPILFKQFSLQRVNQKNYLSWIVDNVHEIQNFEIQKSNDLTSFSTIAQLNRSNSFVYDFLDDSEPQSQKLYYRIKANLTDGLSVYTETLELNFNPYTKFQLYQNPFDSSLKLIVESELDIPMQIKITDITGKKVYEQTFEVKKGNQAITINSEKISSGIYILSAQLGNQSFTHKILK